MARSRPSKPRHDAVRGSKSPPDGARGSDRRRPERSDWLLAAIAALGMLVTGYLTITAWGDSAPLLCREGGGCDLIQRSQWSRLLGLPIALWGFLTYALLVLLSLAPMTRLRRWQRSWTVAFIGLAISLYLTAAGWIALDAFCAWCLLSLLLIGTFFVVLGMHRPVSAPAIGWRPWLLNHALFGGVLLLALHMVWSGMFTPRADPRLTALAQHLERTDAKFYGASWCPTCREQKELFGAAADALPYVECSPGGRQGGIAFECASAEIRNFPTWIIRGRRYEQLMQPDELASRSGFRWQPPATDVPAAD